MVYKKVVSLHRIYAIDHEWYISSAGTMFILWYNITGINVINLNLNLILKQKQDDKEWI